MSHQGKVISKTRIDQIEAKNYVIMTQCRSALRHKYKHNPVVGVGHFVVQRTERSACLSFVLSFLRNTASKLQPKRVAHPPCCDRDNRELDR